MSKLIPHTANALSLATSINPAGTNDNLAFNVIADAPNDGKKYVRMNGEWVALDGDATTDETTSSEDGDEKTE